MVDLGFVIGSEQGGKRPCVVVQNDVGNAFSKTTIIAPITSKAKLSKTSKPYHVTINNFGVLQRTSYIMTEQLRAISKDRLKKHLGHLSQNEMTELDTAMRISLAI